MARLEFTFTVLFLIIVGSTTTASARNVVKAFDLDRVLEREFDLSQPDADSALLLPVPVDKTEVKPTNVVEIDPETSESKDFQTDLPKFELKRPDPVRPFTTVMFRPVNRHFPGKRSYRFRIASHGCHEETKKPSLKNKVMGHGREIMFGDDMIFSQSKQPQMFPGRVVNIKNHRHGRHNRGGEMRRFPFSKRGHEMLGLKKSKGEEGRNWNGNGIVKRIRKFLDLNF